MTLFHALSFFTLGFLCLVSCIGLYLSYLFKAKSYYYYFGYIVAIMSFIIAVYYKSEGYFPANSFNHYILKLVIDVVQMIISYFFAAFIYHALIQEDLKFNKLRFVLRFFTGFTFLYLLIAIIFPYFVLESIPFFIATRVVLFLISLVIYVTIAKHLNLIYFRFLFLALNFLLLSGFLALWDSVTNYYADLYLGFSYLCVGYILENICFAAAFIYKYFSTDQLKKKGEIQYELQLSTVQLEIQQQTMEHIGRELHDNIGQKLSLVSLYSQQLAFENKAPSIKNAIDNISDIVNQSLKDLRQLSKSFIDNKIENASLNELLALECDSFNELKQCKLCLNSNLSNFNLTYQTKIILLRIAQEFIQNSIKHAQCDTIYITIEKINFNLHFSLQDDGKGFNTSVENFNGIGLVNIKKRILLLGGIYELVSNENGTKLTIEIAI